MTKADAVCHLLLRGFKYINDNVYQHEGLGVVLRCGVFPESSMVIDTATHKVLSQGSHERMLETIDRAMHEEEDSHHLDADSSP
jgi:hypothetical protein